MNMYINRLEKVGVSRRQVMIGAAGLTFAIALGGRADAAAVATERAGQALRPWVSIAPDGTITIMSAATEMGQGSMTSPPLIIAEELDADWGKVRIVPAPVNEKIYGNPGFGGMMYTAGSNAVTSYYKNLRLFGAQARRVLLDNAAKKLGVPVPVQVDIDAPAMRFLDGAAGRVEKVLKIEPGTLGHGVAGGSFVEFAIAIDFAAVEPTDHEMR